MKRCCALLLAALLLLTLCACGGEEPPAPETGAMEEAWLAEAIPLSANLLRWNCLEEICLCEGKLCVSGRHAEGPALSCYDTETETWTDFSFSAPDTSLRSLSAADGLCWALLRGDITRETPCFSLLRVALREGAAAEIVPIGFEAAPLDEGGYALFLSLYALDAERALLCDSENACLIDAQGNCLHKIPLGSCEPFAVRVDNELYFRDTEGGLRRFDAQTQAFAERLEREDIRPGESENGHLFSDDPVGRVYAADTGEGEAELLFNWMDVALSSAMVSHRLFETASGELFYPGSDCLVRVRKTLVKARTELRLLTLALEDPTIPDSMKGAGMVLDAILAFNHSNPDYRIAVTTLRGSREELSRQLVELATAGGYDLVDTGALPDGALDSGLLLDLLPFLDADAELSRDSFLPAALEGMLRGGKLYAVTPRLTVMTWAIRAEDDPGREQWNCDYVNQMITGRGDQQVFFWTMGQETFRKTLARAATAEFIDLGTLQCCFDDGRFAHWLELLRDIPYSAQYLDLPCLFSPCYEMDAMLLDSSMRNLRSNQIRFVGFPEASGSGCYFAPPGQNLNSYVTDSDTRISLGILADSTRPDAAWEFVRLVLLHRAGTGRGFSVLKERLEEELAALAENDREENGGFTFSQEEIAHLRELACSADGTVLADEQLLTLIETAMQDFLSGRYPSAQAAAEDLQSRAAIYLAEQHG